MSVRFRKWICVAVFAAILLCGCSGQDTDLIPPTFESVPPADRSDPMRERVLKRCEEIHGLYAEMEKPAGEDSRSAVDAIETLLMEAGLDVVDTDGIYPDYLTTADRFRDFWVTRQEPAEQEVITIRESGALAYTLFSCQEDGVYTYIMHYPPEEGEEPYFEQHEVLDWALTDRGNFYYQLYPAGDKHYSDYTLLRLNPPDRELFDLNLKYIRAGGYIGTNLFLTDWSEDDFGALSFNDLWEYLYYDCYGQHFSPEGYKFMPERECYQIPAAEFEAVVLPYFEIALDAFRDLAHYDEAGDFYPWRPIQTNDYSFLGFYDVEPEVISGQANPDGTVTLQVWMLSTDLKTDCLFSHEVTVRPLDDGRFQFVGNRITSRTEYGLPYCEPRLTWEKP